MTATPFRRRRRKEGKKNTHTHKCPSEWRCATEESWFPSLKVHGQDEVHQCTRNAELKMKTWASPFALIGYSFGVHSHFSRCFSPRSSNFFEKSAKTFHQVKLCTRRNKSSNFLGKTPFIAFIARGKRDD